MRKRIQDAVKKGYGGIYLDSGQKAVAREGGGQGKDIIVTTYDEAGSELKKVSRELGLDPKDVKKLDYKNPKVDIARGVGFGDYSGYYYEFTPKFRTAVLEKGINAFKKGGPINIQQSLDELNKKVLPNPPDVGSIEPYDELDELLAQIKPIGSDGVESILMSMALRGMNPLQRSAQVRKFLKPLEKKLSKLEKDKQAYIQANKANKLEKYKQRINRYNNEIEGVKKEMGNVKELFNPNNI